MINNTQIDLAQKTHELFQNQISDWPLLKTNHNNLVSVEHRAFSYPGFEIVVQHNPARIISTSANVSPSIIQNRKCFLCKENRPVEQVDLFYDYDHVILANPFPILAEHFTITSRQHVAQSIENNIPTMLKLSRDLGEKYSIYYSGPRCGASAPDHMHFQAGTKNILPIEKDFVRIKETFLSVIRKTNNFTIYSLEKIFRNGIVIESGKMDFTSDCILKVIHSLKYLMQTNEEPMLNMICSYDKEEWRIIIFPRIVHRPKEYFASDSEKLLISPAVIDLGGLLITPRKEDFEKITKENIANIFRQVTLDNLTHKKLVSQLTNILS